MPRVILGELQLSPFKPYPQLPFPKKLKAVATPRMPSTLPTTATAPARSRTPLVDSVGYSRGIDATPPRNLLNAFLKSASKRVEAGDEREGGTRSGTSSPSTSNKRVEEPSRTSSPTRFPRISSFNILTRLFLIEPQHFRSTTTQGKIPLFL